MTNHELTKLKFKVAKEFMYKEADSMENKLTVLDYLVGNDSREISWDEYLILFKMVEEGEM